MAKNQKSKQLGQVTKPQAGKDKASEPKILLADDDSVSDESEDHNKGSVIDDVSIHDRDEDESDNEKSVSDEEELESHVSSNTTLRVPTKEAFQSDGKYHNKQRCLIICSRGITSRVRHLLEDLRTLIPHHKKDSKIDINKNEKGGIGSAVNDIAEMRGCNSVLFLECRKKQDAYLWLGHTKSASVSGLTSGPSAKFLVENIHTMDELRLTGNCMRGSRPILAFDPAFDEKEELKLLKCLFLDVFGTPRGHPKSKPFVDRVMGFYHADGKIWVRNYQIIQEHASNAKEAHQEKKLTGSDMKTSLVEIGPRFVLNPIRIFRGSFGGQTLYQNEHFVSPNAMRASYNQKRGNHYKERQEAKKKRKTREEGIVVPQDPLDSVFK
eukprot:CAMPEP_0176481296 /NCGR_PEP_ID=MMETSP0200_2-20121128/2742_1 /TAXON_ID=947934 /ORGANISM="Chaetoceros sp., Strain GSL56" /LENGTH=380 /DNA_ID=CAMNT_0017877487 /DNA_START=31 /DNA_END=1173 /DNA_ORIENTATION=-